jgi:hypothetical protein
MLNEGPSWKLPGGNEDKHINLRMLISQPRFKQDPPKYKSTALLLHQPAWYLPVFTHL